MFLQIHHPMQFSMHPMNFFQQRFLLSHLGLSQIPPCCQSNEQNDLDRCRCQQYICLKEGMPTCIEKIKADHFILQCVGKPNAPCRKQGGQPFSEGTRHDHINNQRCHHTDQRYRQSGQVVLGSYGCHQHKGHLRKEDQEVCHQHDPLHLANGIRQQAGYRKQPLHGSLGTFPAK